MQNNVIKVLKGHSGSTVELVQYGDTTVVKKTNNIDRNLERIPILNALGIQLPKIINIDSNSYLMEYIPHDDMCNWLTNNSPSLLTATLESTIEKLSLNSVDKDYTDIYESKLSPIFSSWYGGVLPFTKTTLINKLPKILPQSEYHGDLSLDNIIYNKKTGFYFIDPLTSVYDSWVFDITKLRQDLHCGWFIRHNNIALDAKLTSISDRLQKICPWFNDPFLLILMLLRILPYANDKKDQQWLLTHIYQLWK